MSPKALSRPLKFRAWNPETKTYGYFEPFKRFELSAERDYDGYMGTINTWRYKKGATGDMGMYYEFSISHENVGDLVFQQYTELHDKNGKEIYEGDVMLTDDMYHDYEDGVAINALPDGKLHQVEWKNGAFFVGDEFLFEVSTVWEVAGDVYSNPELLN